MSTSTSAKRKSPTRSAIRTQNDDPKNPPILALNPANNIPYKIRSNVLSKFFVEFCRILANYISNDPLLPHQFALDKEADIYSFSSGNLTVYKNRSASELMALRKQQTMAPEIEQASSESRKKAKQEYAFKKQSQVIDYEKAKQFILHEADLRTWNYPTRDVLTIELVTKDEKKPALTWFNQYNKAKLSSPDLMSTVYKVCDRCQKLFVVRADLKPHHYSECEYHWGRSYVSSENGEKQQIYSCCSLAYGSPGCEVGPHVWKETSMTELHKSIPFIETPDSNSSAKFPVGKHKVIALDCEMCYTTAGFELSRLSVLDSTGDVILDELVKPSQFAKIVDLNTKYSGIISLEDAEFSLEEIREKLLQMIDRDTIIIGQSLENDFKVLRLIHPTVIDTSLLFPHPKGPPHRYSLKHLSRRYLQIFIQASEHGHDSAEDARSCIDLVRLKIEKGKDYGVTLSKP